VTAVLECEGVSKRFGGVRAVAGVTLAVGESELFAIIGPNGAGKTTLLNVACGLLRPDSGRVRLAGADITRSTPWRNASRGLARTLQSPVVFPDLTVLENVMLGHVARHRISFTAAILGLPRVHRWERTARQKGEELLQLVGLEAQAQRLAAELPLGQRRLVELARGLATEPKVMLLDEPAAGLARGEVDRLAALLRAASERGIAICLVEHNMRLVMAIAERIFVLHHGEPLFEGTAAEVRKNPAVVAAYLGSRPITTDADAAS
jgi:ABC-type branched-subunit amino acid transport system ATPase component